MKDDCRPLWGGEGKGRYVFFRVLLVFFVLFSYPLHLFAWPTASDWIPVYKGGVLLQDPNNDTNGSRNVVSDATHDAAFIFNDGQYIYFRLRLDDNPAGTGGQGLLKSFGWGVVLDTNLNAGNYEWMLMLDGISENGVNLWQNTIQRTLGDPSDVPEVLASSIPLLGNYLISLADTSFNGDQDYFLDWRFPYATFKQKTGLTDSSPIRMFFGASPSANNLTENGGDLVGGSDLYSGFSDYVTPLGPRPTTGTVKFVENLAGSGDMTQTCAGNTLYLRVDDIDQNYISTSLQTVTVALTTPGGDSETKTLTETGVNTGIFTGSIATLSGTATANNGILNVMPGETVTITYIDAIDATLNRNQPRTDTLLISPPIISIIKTVTPTSADAGGEVTYSITLTNTSCGDGWLRTIQDVLASGFSYVAGSSSGLTTQNPTINGQILEWNGTWTIPAYSSVTLSFRAKAGSIAGTHYNNASASGANFSSVSTGNTAPVTVTGPLMSLTKAVDKASANPGQELIYSIHYHNIGNSSAQAIIIFDTVPLNTTYVSGSLRIGNAGSTYTTASTLTDAADSDQGRADGSSIIFSIPSVPPDDGAANSGTDEGMLYFKVRVN